jgi:hypothetical protein
LLLPLVTRKGKLGNVKGSSVLWGNPAVEEGEVAYRWDLLVKEECSVYLYLIVAKRRAAEGTSAAKGKRMEAEAPLCSSLAAEVS